MKIINTRDLQDRLTELQSDYEIALENPDDAADFEESNEFEELQELENLSGEICDWNGGNDLIHEDDFTEYVTNYVMNQCWVAKDVPDFVEIDWQTTAQNYRAAFSECEYLGETYYYLRN